MQVYDSGLEVRTLWVKGGFTMFDEGFEIGEILEESEYFFGRFKFVFDIVFVEGGDVVVESIDIGALLDHGWLR